jgi:hypothetical protein
MFSPQLHTAFTHHREEELKRQAERRWVTDAAPLPAPAPAPRSSGRVRRSLARLHVAPPRHA